MTPSPYEGSSEAGRGFDGAPTSAAGSASGATGGAETKRKYRRHPKPDENAPERPPSAYVIFSNKVREEVKDQKLTFTQIAKLVGERWQKLDPEGKEPFEAEANAAKEKYNIQLSTYKKTDTHKDYTLYLTDFKSKHGGASEQKRPRLDQESSSGSISVRSALQSDLQIPGPGGHVRGDSTGSMSSTTYAPVMPSPGALAGPSLPAQLFSPGTAYSHRGPVSTSRGGSPTGMQPGRESQLRPQLSAQSSLSDESPGIRTESDALVQTASLSLSTPQSATPPLASLPSFEQSVAYDGSRRFQQTSLQTTTPSLASQSMSGSSLGNPFGQTLPTSATSEHLWRGRPLDLRGFAEPGRAMQPPPLLTSVAPSSTFSLPPLMGADRFSDPQRTLPPPRGSPISQQQSGLPPGARLTDSSRPYHFGSTPRRRAAHGDMHASLDRSESDAADALAGLAAGEPRAESARHGKQQWQHR